MRNIKPRQIGSPTETHSSDYLKGYRDGLREGRAASRRFSADGLLGALLAISLVLGIGYLGYHYLTTGEFLPGRSEIDTPLQNSNTPAL